MKRLFLLILIAAAALPTSAQRMLQPEQVRTPESHSDGVVIHVTDVLNAMPEAVTAINEFHRLKSAGLLPYPNKTFESTAVGDTSNFRQLNLVTSDWLVRPFI
ncbi:MAG: hypothetical protein R3178_06175, partial [Rhodothermales bacterium]|nr:hypothetical protein [Rhodothermales bacterium]